MTPLTVGGADAASRGAECGHTTHPGNPCRYVRVSNSGRRANFFSRLPRFAGHNSVIDATSSLLFLT